MSHQKKREKASSRKQVAQMETTSLQKEPVFKSNPRPTGTSLQTNLKKKDMPTNKKLNKLGIALVGLGKYATGQLAPALQETKNCYLAGIVTGSPDKAREWKRKYDIPEKNIYNYENFDSIRDNPDIDIVYVVLPNALHKEYV